MKVWSSVAAAKPAFTKLSSVEEQLNEKPDTASPGEDTPKNIPKPPPSKKP